MPTPASAPGSETDRHSQRVEQMRLLSRLMEEQGTGVHVCFGNYLRMGNSATNPEVASWFTWRPEPVGSPV